MGVVRARPRSWPRRGHCHPRSQPHRSDRIRLSSAAQASKTSIAGSGVTSRNTCNANPATSSRCDELANGRLLGNCRGRSRPRSVRRTRGGSAAVARRFPSRVSAGEVADCRRASENSPAWSGDSVTPGSCDPLWVTLAECHRTARPRRPHYVISSNATGQRFLSLSTTAARTRWTLYESAKSGIGTTGDSPPRTLRMSAASFTKLCS